MDFSWEIWEGSVLWEVSLRLINEHSIMAQNVSASLKAENLRLQWLKLTVVGYRKPKICCLIRVQYSL